MKITFEVKLTMSTHLPEEEPGSTDEWSEDLESGDEGEGVPSAHDFPSDEK
jgi:hypothetical protein